MSHITSSPHKRPEQLHGVRHIAKECVLTRRELLRMDEKKGAGHERTRNRSGEKNRRKHILQEFMEQ